MEGEGPLQRYLKERSAEVSSSPIAHRTVGELLRAAEAYTNKRRRMEAEESARENARREREAAIARERYLDRLVGRETDLWAEVDALVGTKQPKRYEQAVGMLLDLRDLDAHGKGSDFRMRLEALRQVHARKPSFIDQLMRAGL